MIPVVEGVAQTEQVLNLVRRLADNGLAVVLISHNLNDVFEVADNIAALYLGNMAAQVDKNEVIDTGVPEVAVACPFCRIMVGDGMVARQSDVEVLDVAQVLLRNVKR